MTTTPSRRRLGSEILGIITVIATLFSGLVASPATAAVTANSATPTSNRTVSPDYGNIGNLWGYLYDTTTAEYADVNVYLVDAATETEVAQTTTDILGGFSFPDLAPGDYYLHFVAAADGYDEWYEGGTDTTNATPITLTVDHGAQVIATAGGGSSVGSGSAEGTVTDSDGNPLTAISVTLLTTDGSGVATTQTNSSGFYSLAGLSADTYTVCFAGTGYVNVCYGGASNYYLADMFEVVDGEATLLDDVAMELAGGISGNVWPSIESVYGLDGVSVSAYQFNGYGWEAVATVETDGAGHYQFDTLGAGYYRVVADPADSLDWVDRQPEWYPNATNMSLATAVSVVSGSTTEHIDFSLNEGGTIEATAYCDTFGSQCMDATITVEALDGTLPEMSRSVDFSTYTFYGLPDGRYRVSFTHDGNTVYWGGDETSAGSAIITIQGGQEVTGISYVFPATVSPSIISGTISGLDGAELTVYLLGEPQNPWSDRTVVDVATTDESGYYEFYAPAGRYTIQFGDTESFDSDGNLAATGADYWGGAYRLQRATWFDIDGGDALTCDFTRPARAAVITGTVKNNAATPVGQVGVTVTLTSVNGSATTVTTTGGAYRVEGLAPGLYTLSMERNGLTSTWNQAVRSRPTVNVTSSSGTFTLNGTMAIAGASISGRVTGGGVAITDAPIFVIARKKTDDCAVSVTQADGSGNYVLTGLPAGTYSVTASSVYMSACEPMGGGTPSATTNWVDLSKDITVTVNQTLTAQNFALTAGAKIRGTVRNADGSLASSGNQVAVYGLNDEYVAYGDIQEDGTFEVLGLSAGSYYVEAWESSTGAPGWWTNGTGARVPVTVTAGQTLSSINLTAPAGATVTGIIRAANSRPLTGDIQAYDVRGLPVGYANFTDSETGAYTITSLPEGPIRIKFTVGGQSYWVGGGSSIGSAGVTYTSEAGTSVARELVVSNLGSVSGEATVGGVGDIGTVTLIDSLGREIAQQNTSNGKYSFSNISAGLYTVRFVSFNREFVWFGNKDSLATATYFTVAAGAVVDNINLNATVATAGFVPGVVTTTGTLKVGQTMTAAAGTWTPTPTAVQYRWYTDWAGAPVSTATTYVLKPEDQGKFLHLEIVVSKAGVASDLIRIDLGRVQGIALTASPVPTITPATAPKVGVVLTAAPGTWTPAPVTLSYQWLRGGTPILGATASTYTPTVDDLGARLSVRVTGTKAGYFGVVKDSTQLLATVLNTITAPATIVAPTVTAAVLNTKKPGDTLTAVPGTWGPAPVGLNFQWKRGGTAIPGATSQTYVLTSEDVNASITVTVTGSKIGFTPVDRTSPAITGITALTTKLSGSTPTISGTKQVGETLTATAGTWTAGTATAFQWFRDGAPIRNAIGSTYVLTGADLGATIRVQVKGTKVGFDALTKVSAATTAIIAGTIDFSDVEVGMMGTLSHGYYLAAVPTGWTIPVKLTYQWFRNGVAIPGATKRNYQILFRDTGYYLSYTVTASATGYTSITLTSDDGLVVAP